LQVYHECIHKKFRRSWKPAPGGSPVHIRFTVEKDGSITDAVVHESSGDATRDESALAFVRGQTLDALPVELAERLGRLQIDYLL